MEGNFKNLEQFHLGDFLITVEVCGLNEEFNLLRSGVAILLHSHSVVQVALDLRNAQVAILILIVFLKDHVDCLADLLVAANHNNIILKMEETFTVAIGEERVSAPRRLADVSEYISNILFIGQGQEEIEIDPNIISSHTFQQVLSFYELNDYKNPEVTRPIRTNNLQDVLDKKNYEFIKDFFPPNENTYKILAAAEFLVCNGLKRVLAALFACKLYFEDDKPSYEKKIAELGVTKSVSFEDDERYKAAFVFSTEQKAL